MTYGSLLSYMFEEQSRVNEMTFTLWDTGHGLSIWIKTPSGQNHWIDAGKNDDFSPSEHVYKSYGERSLDYLILSHPDSDHIADLPNMLYYFDGPKVLMRNKTLPTDAYEGASSCKQAFASLNTHYTSSVDWDKSPKNPQVNGGIEIKTGYLNYSLAGSINNSSVAALYYYAGFLFVCPGDIEPNGWNTLWTEKNGAFSSIVDKAVRRVLIAPHHGRDTCYCQEMMDSVNPHLVIIADKWGGGTTDRRYRENPIGLNLSGRNEKYKSTKTTGRMKFTIREDGIATFSEV